MRNGTQKSVGRRKGNGAARKSSISFNAGYLTSGLEGKKGNEIFEATYQQGGERKKTGKCPGSYIPQPKSF